MTRLDAIADPLRLRLVQHLEDAPGATLPQLADAAGVHLNTVRPHIVALEEAGVVVRETQPSGARGRPAVGYRLVEDWTPPTTDFLGLAELLAAVLLRGSPSPDEVHEIGLEWGRYLLGRPGVHDVERELPLALERLGFHARVRGDALELAACPCSLVMPDRPELLCELAVAVADGVLAACGSGLKVGRRVHHPDVRRCSVGLETVAA